MKKTSTLAPLLIGSLVAIFQFSSAPQTRAFGGSPGGPFSNGSYFPNDGTFSAVVRGENLTGTVQFSTTSGSGKITEPPINGGGGSGSTGVSTLYYDGDTCLGNSQGAYNPQASTMTVNFQADVEGQGAQNYQISNAAGTAVTEIYYFDGLYINGYADCKTSNAFPNQKFSGSGKAVFQFLDFYTATAPFLPVVTREQIDITITGVRLSNTASSFATSTVRPPSVNEFSVQ